MAGFVVIKVETAGPPYQLISELAWAYNFGKINHYYLIGAYSYLIDNHARYEHVKVPPSELELYGVGWDTVIRAMVKTIPDGATIITHGPDRQLIESELARHPDAVELLQKFKTANWLELTAGRRRISLKRLYYQLTGQRIQPIYRAYHDLKIVRQCHLRLQQDGLPNRPDPLEEAVKQGNLEYLNEHQSELEVELIGIACRHGQLACLKLLYRLFHGYYNIYVYMALAARHGHLDCLKYMIEQGWYCPTAFLKAALGGHFDCLRLLIDRQPQRIPANELLNATVQGRDLNCFLLALHSGCKPNHRTVPLAIKKNAWYLIDLLLEIGAEWTGEGLNKVLAQGHIGCLQRLHREWSTDDLLRVLESKNVAAVELLLNEGASYTQQVFERAIHWGDFSCIKCLYEHGHPTYSSGPTAAVRAGGEIFHYLIERISFNRKSLRAALKGAPPEFSATVSGRQSTEFVPLTGLIDTDLEVCRWLNYLTLGKLAQTNCYFSHLINRLELWMLKGLSEFNQKIPSKIEYERLLLDQLSSEVSSLIRGKVVVRKEWLWYYLS